MGISCCKPKKTKTLEVNLKVLFEKQNNNDDLHSQTSVVNLFAEIHLILGICLNIFINLKCLNI